MDVKPIPNYDVDVFCCDCKHHIFDSYKGLHLCYAPVRKNYINGGYEPEECWTRNSDGHCRYYEEKPKPRQPWWKRIFAAAP